ncbi:GntR family transcriptional regulator [Trinickia sp. EG282A]|uniref:GntR family transcriptional regulator n=1 Tax=Trinickia sp. EG282A TaxID=3237013 RepID=UPI0034D1F9DD
MSTDRHIEPGSPQVSLSLAPIGGSLSLRDRAYASLRRAIAETDIYESREDIRLDEKELAEALGVSRTPVREAMTLLEQEGFLRTVPRRGVYIQRKTKREIVEMIYMWAALESMAARLATARASDAEIAGLRRIFADFGETTPAEHVDEYSEANIAFHQAVFELSQSSVLVETSKNIFMHVRAIRRMTIGERDRAARSIHDHMRIIEALEARDTELAEQLARQHSLDLAAFVEGHCDFLD